ncbi:unnamed protein product [Acanthosepion pharaonis]|uniref:Transmembrane protein n=1 Tax=Acanthosepion pharaonis TaxID=158019 RepID=A0A812BIV8_ACAPH|nr:unnamed protein product [Sepia pharaonis]
MNVVSCFLYPFLAPSAFPSFYFLLLFFLCRRSLSLSLSHSLSLFLSPLPSFSPFSKAIHFFRFCPLLLQCQPESEEGERKDDTPSRLHPRLARQLESPTPSVAISEINTGTVIYGYTRSFFIPFQNTKRALTDLSLESSPACQKIPIVVLKKRMPVVTARVEGWFHISRQARSLQQHNQTVVHSPAFFKNCRGTVY